MSLSFPSIWVPGSSFILASCLIGKEAISSLLLDQWAGRRGRGLLSGLSRTVDTLYMHIAQIIIINNFNFAQSYFILVGPETIKKCKQHQPYSDSQS